jgi:carboxyl-terminal processing protease
VSSYDDPSWYEFPGEKDTNQPTHADNFNSASRPGPDNNNNGTYIPRQESRPPFYSSRYRRPRNTWRQFIIAIILLVIAFLGGWFSHQGFAFSFNPGSQSQIYSGLIQQAWNDVDQHYVDRKAVDYKQMSYQAIRAILAVLNDKGHTRFLTPADVQAENQQLSGTFTGIGVYLQQNQTTKQLIITATIPGSPAEKAGFRRGDILLAVNGVSIVGKDVDTVSPLIQGKAGTAVSIKVQRPSTQQILTISVVRAEITVPNVILHYIAEDHIAQIQIVQFANGVSDQLKSALDQAKTLGATRIILDLRDDPGGYLQEAIDTASEFIANGTVLQEQDSKGNRTSYQVDGNPINTTSPIVVLVNNNTASAAEIVSGALQDDKRAIIMGMKTYGTGTVLQEFPLSDGSALLLGTSEWLTPDGHFIRNQGITPNITVNLSASALPLEPNDENVAHMSEQQILSSGDTQLVAAIHYLERHSTTSTQVSRAEASSTTTANGQLALEPAFFPAEA